MAISGRKVGYRLETREITASEASAKKITLSRSPQFPNLVLMFVADSGTHLVNDVDFQIDGSELSWEGYEMDGLIEAGDRVSIVMP